MGQSKRNLNQLRVGYVSFAVFVFSLFLNFAYPVGLQAEDQNAQNRQCRVFQTNSNYFFDDFETHDYASGFLALHFKLKTPYNDGRTWFDRVILYKQDCTSQDFLRTQTVDPIARLSAVRAGMQYYSIRFLSLTHYDVWDDEQDVKLQCDNGCSVDIPAKLSNGFDYSQVSYAASIDGNSGFYISSSLPIKDDSMPKRNPLLIIPGVLGTELNLGNDKIWPNLAKIITNPNDKFMDQLQMDQLGRPVNATVTLGNMIDNINYVVGSFHYSDLLLTDLAQAGYIKGQNLFVMPYDWRLGIADLANTLQQNIQQILASTGASKVDIIAHSMGGLIVKEYILNIKNSQPSDGSQIPVPHIGKAIFVGTPNLGAAEAAKILLFGDSLNIPFLNSDEIQFLAQNMPSIYDLLPSVEYYKHSAGFYDDLTNSNNKAILDYNQSKSFLLSLGKNSKLIAKSESLHTSALDNLDFSGTGTIPYNIVGCGVFTVKTINKMYYGQPTLIKQLLNNPKYRIYSDSGDGTVLFPSAAYLKTDPANTYFVDGANHNQLLSSDGSRQLIVALISGGIPTLPGSITQNTSNCGLQGKLISLPSKLELNIINPQSGVVLVPGVDYQKTKIGDDNYIFLPTKRDQKYKVTAVAPVDKKPVSIVTTTYNNQKPVYNYYNNVTINQDLSLEVGTDTPDALQNVGQGGNSVSVLPTYTENDDQQDLQAPGTKVQKYGDSALIDSGNINFQNGQNQVALITQDDKSGILTTQYSLDAGDTWFTAGSAPITINTNQPSIMFYSQDKAGNVENVHTVNFIWPQQQPPIVTSDLPVVTGTGKEIPVVLPSQSGNIGTPNSGNSSDPRSDSPLDSPDSSEASSTGSEDTNTQANNDQGQVLGQSTSATSIKKMISVDGYPNISVNVNVNNAQPIEPVKTASPVLASNSTNSYVVSSSFFHRFIKFVTDLIFF